MPDASPAATRLQYSASKWRRMLAERLRHRRAGLDLVLDVHHETREAGVAVAARDDLERLQQRHAGLQHRRELAREERDVLLVDLAPAAERLPLDLDDPDALAAQVGRDDGLGRRLRFAADLAVAAVDAFPEEREFLDVASWGGGCGGHDSWSSCDGRRRHSLVMASISSSDVMPDLTLSRPDWRRSRTPSFCAWSAMSIALPLRMMTWRMSSVMGITW